MPNVLLLMADQLRFDALGCYGAFAAETPNLDALARQSACFLRAYSPSPSCVPARACLLTGMSPWGCGVLGMGQNQPPMSSRYSHTLPGELAKAGFDCVGVGKMHFSPQRAKNGFARTILDESGRHEDPGFCSDYEAWFRTQMPPGMPLLAPGMDWNGWNGAPYPYETQMHPTVWTAGQALSYLRERDRDRPFYLKVSFARPHSPYDAPEEYYARFRDRELPRAVRGDWDGCYRQWDAKRRRDPWRAIKTDDEIQCSRAGYYGNVALIDEWVGSVLNELKAQGVYEDTLILFTSDHGDMLGDHGLWRKTYPYEGSAHIPLLIKLPGQAQGITPGDPVVLQDVMPTVLNALGLPIPETVEGVSLLPVFSGRKIARARVHGEHSQCYSPQQENHFLVEERYKYIWLDKQNREQLFDLQQDPMEQRDLAAEPAHRGELLRLRGELIRLLEPRNCGLVKNGRLKSQRGRLSVRSPHYPE